MQRSGKTPRLWKLRLTVAASILLSACSSAPKRDKQLWLGSPDVAGLERRVGDQSDVIKCTDPLFNKFVCMTYPDYDAMREACRK
jgi:hypothetical protein